MGRTKSLKNEVKDILVNASEIPNTIDISTTLYPDNEKQKDEMYKQAEAIDTSIVVTYAGRKFLQNTTGLYITYNAFTVFIFSKILVDDNNNSSDIENLLDIVTDVLYQKGYVLFEDAPRPVKDEKTGLFEAVLIIGKNTQYSGPEEE